MITGPTFWLIIATGAAVLVGLAFGLISRRGRRTQRRDRAEGNGGKNRS